MTALSKEWSFQISLLPQLRSAEKLDADTINGIWMSIDNDTFFSLATYVVTFSDTKLNGYKHKEDREAFESCAKTLDALEHVVERMNQSEALLDFAKVVITDGRVERKDVQATWDGIIAEVTAMPMVKLLRVVNREFVGWATGLDRGDISALLKYAPKPERRDVELAFSGGGLRAAAFALGSLFYVADVKRSERIRQISSVSGGSITNGFLANMFSSTGSFDHESAAEFARRLALYGIPLEKAAQKLASLLGVSMALGMVGCLLILLGALGEHKELLGSASLSFASFLARIIHEVGRSEGQFVLQTCCLSSI